MESRTTRCEAVILTCIDQRIRTDDLASLVGEHHQSTCVFRTPGASDATHPNHIANLYGSTAQHIVQFVEQNQIVRVHVVGHTNCNSYASDDCAKEQVRKQVTYLQSQMANVSVTGSFLHVDSYMVDSV